VALLFLGFVASSRYDDKQTVSLEAGISKEVLDGYTLTYVGARSIDNEREGYAVEVRHGNDRFTVMPVMRYSSQTNSMMRHPDILNMYTRDFYISPLSVETPDEVRPESFTFRKGETKKIHGLSVTFTDYDFNDEEKGKMVTGNGEVTIGVMLTVVSDSKSTVITPLFKRTGTGPEFVPASVPGSPIQFSIGRMEPNRENPAASQVEITVLDASDQKGRSGRQTLVVEASVKPYINLVWMGTITLIVGFIITIIRRVQEAKGKEE
jgi:cytochrome c-type biogenesis protein CcmF